MQCRISSPSGGAGAQRGKISKLAPAETAIGSCMNGSESVPGISWNLLSLDSNAATNARLTFPSNAVIQIWTAIPLDLNPSELRSSSCRPSSSDTHHPSRLPNNINQYDLIKG
ncbi:hypothetical protein QR685DRAFT_569360 [Neurospora intermedia]|uniref:Uncharacterized protein n=1 Tax=Neurospora intermedia TaxID=5142 RepID=A0ABR3DKR7_NEUIN